MELIFPLNDLLQILVNKGESKNLVDRIKEKSITRASIPILVSEFQLI